MKYKDLSKAQIKELFLRFSNQVDPEFVDVVKMNPVEMVNNYHDKMPFLGIRKFFS